MDSFKHFLEALHSYGEPDYKSPFQPLKKNDTVKVFHGFYNFIDAFRAAKFGITGRERADRRYSYESDNNPYGLFVTLSLKQTEKFTGPVFDEVSMEFDAKEQDLESPVWPGGGYTVQGGMAQYFGHGRSGKLKRIQRRKDAGKETEDFIKNRPELDYIKQSDEPYKANMLMNSTEYQALFVGDLNPTDIVAFHVRPKGSGYNAPFIKMSREEFLERYKDHSDEPDWNSSKSMPHDRIFLPAEEFDGDKFLKGLADSMHQDDINQMDSNVKHIWQMIAKSDDKLHSMQRFFGHWLWMKQFPKALWWMKNRYG